MQIEKVNNQSLGEEIANAVSHGACALLAAAGTVVAIVSACFNSDVYGIVSASIYGFSLILLYVVSTLYHSLAHNRAKKVFQVLDHCSIFFLILGSLTPVALCLVRGAMGWTLFGINTFVTIMGIIFNAIDLKKWSKISLILYVMMGWSVLIAVKPILQKCSATGLIFLAGGGVLYMLGIIFYKMKSRKYTHYIWHMFVFGGSAMHYFFILFHCLPLK